MYLFLPLLQAQAEPFHDFHVQSNEENFTKENTTSVFSPETSKETFLELNIGLASLGSPYFFQGLFPGASLLFGGTISSSGLVCDVQIGAALPSLITGKIGVGIGNLDRNISLAVRPWPLTIGPQIKIEQFTLSLEIGTERGSSFQAGFIGTVGYRWIF